MLQEEKSTRPDIGYVVHQCARFSQDPKRSHGEAVKRIVRYLKGTADKGIILDPQSELSFDCYADADFCGNWDPSTGPQDSMTSKSRTDFL